jgi:hypothetical protein
MSGRLTPGACVLLLLASAAAHAAAAPAAEAPTLEPDPFLAELAGDWDLKGTVQGKSVHYRGTARWTLKQSWLCLTLAELPSGYQASVYLGYDIKADDYIAHWLDQYGAAGARVVGSGKLRGHTLVLLFPYAEGGFRDTFSLADDGSRGSLLLESQQKNGQWAPFASYAMTRVHAPAKHAPARNHHKRPAPAQQPAPE